LRVSAFLPEDFGIFRIKRARMVNETPGQAKYPIRVST
jgi:hypothetical protein